jgi:aminoglycoside phosphotransferase (APT) family kinase protein
LFVLRSHIDEVIADLIEAMTRQRSTKAAQLSRDRLLALGEILRAACIRMEALGIPDALSHNDLSPGNILSDGAHYVFTDWSEATVGNPFLTCERLCQLNRAHAVSVRNVYRECWSHRLGAQSMNEALRLTRLLAIYAYLYGRGHRLDQTDGVQPQFESYARSLARHMDRVAQDLSLGEILCH